ncbi:hypothetical protein Poli38472_009842 [Pythium oligandrum]|uniref:Vesicle transport protein USE1 n=1 Tax=Pythium oligandrum TaxID=41045 RepID=A0A8K1CF73_PYTOL|nr:hypothetical protein Poli38472_009842 [Pythium oligandrum]|eukprot:TMW62349.1 hypothetical protein Poli38472_009842 [Pythium oligandrum]
MTTAMMAQVLEAERFVRAWKRFRERFPEEEVDKEQKALLRQYVTTAEFLYQSIPHTETPEQWQDLLYLLNDIKVQSGLLLTKRCAMEEAPSCVVPRSKEIFRRRRQREESRREVEANAGIADRVDEPIEEESPEQPEVDLLQFSPDDFKSMLEAKEDVEEKLSTIEIRKRLGLVDRAAADQVTSSSESQSREEQENIQSEMFNLAKQLKETTQTINQSLVEDVKILDAVGQSAESNTEHLDRENEVLKRQLASSIGLWTSVCLVMGAVVVFMATYIYMKLFSRRHW